MGPWNSIIFSRFSECSLYICSGCVDATFLFVRLLVFFLLLSTRVNDIFNKNQSRSAI